MIEIGKLALVSKTNVKAMIAVMWDGPGARVDYAGASEGVY